MKPKEPYFLLERWHQLAGITLDERSLPPSNTSHVGVTMVRAKMNDFMNQDQQMSHDPTARKGLQDEVWAYMNEPGVMDLILQDKGDKGNGDYPTAAFAAWLLVQHMDADPDRQAKFLGQLEKAIPNHVKMKFLKDRTKVNQWIQAHANDEESGCADEKLKGQPTIYTRDQTLFPDGGPTSREQALAAAKRNGNKCLYNAVTQTGAKTQPSYTQKS